MNLHCPFPHDRPGPPRPGDPPCLCRSTDFMDLVNCVLEDMAIWPGFWLFLLVGVPSAAFLVLCTLFGWK